MVTVTPLSSFERSSASLFCLASRRRCAWRSCSTILRLASVAATARRLGNRRVRALIVSGSCVRSSGPQGGISRLFAGVGQPPLVRGADAGNARDDLATLRHERVEQL